MSVDDYVSIADAAKKVRAALRHTFPQTKFSVTSHSDIWVKWTDDGPDVAQVKDALLSASCAEVKIASNGDSYLKAGDHSFWLDRYNVAERAAEEQAREQRRQECAAQEAQRRREAEERRAAATLPSTFWLPVSIPAIPLLRQLNDWVIKQNEKRLPKWKFKFAPDLAVQIQSKVTRKHVILFECVAIRIENVSAKYFIEPKQLRGTAYWKLNFDLFCDEHEQNAAWLFKAKHATYGRNYSRDERINLRQQVISALHPDRFSRLSPDQMLSPSCICCGKGLTDPASAARWVGPECWGSASTSVPHIFKAEASEREPLNPIDAPQMKLPL